MLLMICIINVTHKNPTAFSRAIAYVSFSNILRNLFSRQMLKAKRKIKTL